MINVPLYIAFGAGIVSFVAPCVLPIIPGFLAYLAGVQLSGSAPKRREIFFNSVFFVLGFAIVFSILGVLINILLPPVVRGLEAWLSRIGGTLVIFFGLYLTGLVRISFLEREHKFAVKKRFSSRYITSMVFGAAFAVGWTPCVGAVLGAILTLAATSPGRAFPLLFSYSMGLGIPFLLVGLFAAQANVFIQRLGRWLEYVNIVFGIILIVFGILIFTQNLGLVANWELLNRILLR